MNATLAREFIDETLLSSNVEEAPGNPNADGWWLFFVDGLPIWVTGEGGIVLPKTYE